jgi:hypothetical protein
VPVVEFNRDCPGYLEAALREDLIRATPFLGIEERINGLPVMPLTLRMVQWLGMVRSPFLSKLPADVLITKPDIAADIMMFFWIVSPSFKIGNERAKKRFYKTHGQILKCNAQKTVQEIIEYIEEAFLDSSENIKEGDQKNYYSTAASIVGFFHRGYGLEIDVWENSIWRNLIRKLTGRPNAIDIPLKIAFQLIRAHQKHEHPEMTFHNKLSQPKIDAWLGELNKAA